MSTPFLGQISMFAGNYAPRGFAFCNGQLLPINQYSALFSLLGTTYGGDGRTNFALPDLRSRLPIHQGTGPGLSTYILGEPGGSQVVTLDLKSMPAHAHVLNATKDGATSPSIGSSTLPGTPTVGNPPEFYANPVQGQPALNQHPMDPKTCGFAGAGQPHNNLMPSLCISFIVALEGIFPSRS